MDAGQHPFLSDVQALMPIVPLGLKAYKRQDGFVPETKLRNFYVEKDESGISPDNTLRIQRPGMVRTLTLGLGPIRGMDYRVSTDEMLVVSGTRLFSGGADKGEIAGTGLVAMVGTTFVYAILGGATLYLYDTTLATLAMPDDAGTVVDIDQINQYLLILTSSGKFYWLVPGETTVDPLNFATAEFSPDKAKAIRRVGDEFWIFSDDTIEPWQSTGDLDAPFQRVTGRIYERGVLSRDTVKRFDNSVMWVSDDAQVCRGGAVPQVVSDNAIAERIRLKGGDLSAWVFGIDGHEFYALNIPGQGTFAYDASTQVWSEFSTIDRDTWEARVGYDRQGLVLCGSDNSGAVWRLDPEVGNDDGKVIERVITGTVGFMGNPGRNDSLSVGVGSSGDTVVRVRWMDGQDGYPDYYDELTVRTPFDVASLYRLGRPEQPYRTIEVSCVAPERVRIAGMMANQSWR